MPSVGNAVLAAVACLALAGCNQPRWDTPLDAYKGFAQAVQKGETRLAWDAVSEQSRALLEKRAAEISKASGESIPNDARALFFSSGPPQAIKEIKIVSQEGDVALLSVTPDEGEPKQVRMVKEAGGWKLDVSESLKD